jgi:hypothetical protein
VTNPKYDRENCRKLADRRVASMDLDTLQEFVWETLLQLYNYNEDAFRTDWDDFEWEEE